MKKLIIFLCLIIIFILPFSCDGCGERVSENYEFNRTLIQGNSVMIDLQAEPSSWNSEITGQPNHAQMYQLGPDYEHDTYVFYYRALTDYVGYDTTFIKFERILTSEGYTGARYMYYTVIVNTIVDTTGD